MGTDQDPTEVVHRVPPPKGRLELLIDTLTVLALAVALGIALGLLSAIYVIWVVQTFT